MRAVLAAVLCLVPIAATAQTIKDDRYPPVVKSCPPPLGCVRDKPAKVKRVHRHVRHKARHRFRSVPRPRPRPITAPRTTAKRNIFRAFADEIVKALPASKSLSGVVAPLAAKAREIQASCGSQIISTIRHTYITGTGGRLSLHASGRAVDLKGNPSCIYRHLNGWPGGYSVDYDDPRIRHVHISYAPGGPEWGTRFHHYRSGRRHRRSLA